VVDDGDVCIPLANVEQSEIELTQRPSAHSTAPNGNAGLLARDADNLCSESPLSCARALGRRSTRTELASWSPTHLSEIELPPIPLFGA